MPETTLVVVDDPGITTIHYGVPVCHIGQDGDMLALGHPGIRKAFAAFNAHARHTGQPNLAGNPHARLNDWYGRVTEQWGIFLTPEPGHDGWICVEALEGDDGAQPITVFDLD